MKCKTITEFVRETIKKMNEELNEADNRIAELERKLRVRDVTLKMLLRSGRVEKITMSRLEGLAEKWVDFAAEKNDVVLVKAWWRKEKPVHCRVLSCEDNYQSVRVVPLEGNPHQRAFCGEQWVKAFVRNETSGKENKNEQSIPRV